MYNKLYAIRFCVKQFYFGGFFFMKRFVKFWEDVWFELSIAWNMYLAFFAVGAAVAVGFWAVAYYLGFTTFSWILGGATFLAIFASGIYTLHHPD